MLVVRNGQDLCWYFDFDLEFDHKIIPFVESRVYWTSLWTLESSLCASRDDFGKIGGGFGVTLGCLWVALVVAKR